MTQQYIYNIETGDSSHDGHCISESFPITSTCPPDEMREAHRFIVGLGIDDLTGNYGNTSVPMVVLDYLRGVGALDICAKNFFEEPYGIDRNMPFSDSNPEYRYSYSDGYLGFYLFLLRKIRPTYSFDLMAFDARLDIGGYGLYDS